MRRRVLVQRWPAVPTAPNRIARSARSRRASSVTMIALLPPSSRIVRPNRPATTSATRRPTAVEPVNEISGSRGSVQHLLADDAAGADDEVEDARHAVIGHHAIGDVLHGDRGERRRLGRLPDDGIAADRGDRGVPRPDGDGKIERRDHADRAERMPLLHHPVARPLGGERQAVELARQADREVADVDHLLHFAVAFGANLAHLERDEIAQRFLRPRAARCPDRGRDRRAWAPADRATTSNARAASPMTRSQAAADAVDTVAMRLAGRRIRSTRAAPPPGSSIQPSAPNDAPALRGLMCSRSSRPVLRASRVTSTCVDRRHVNPSSLPPSTQTRRASGRGGARAPCHSARTNGRMTPCASRSPRRIADRRGS